MELIKVIEEHTFNNWGDLTVEFKEEIYHLRWTMDRGKFKYIKSDAPQEVEERIKNGLFDFS